MKNKKQGSSGISKQGVITSAATTALKMYLKNQAGGSTGTGGPARMGGATSGAHEGSGGSGVGGLLSLASKFFQ